jgi:uncharacterized protein
VSKTALFAAAKDWDASVVRQLLMQSPDLVGVRDAKGRTALHICAGVSAQSNRARVPASIATARELLKAGMEINAVHEISDDNEIFPATPLWYALARGQNGQLARFFLKAGANPDNCLWTVIWSKQPEVVRLLLDAGSKSEVRFDGETPLIYSARLGREKAIFELVAAGADITARDSKGRTAAEHARKKRLSQAVLGALGEQQTANPVLNRTRRKRRAG